MELLLQFSVENFLSIKEPVTLSMLASTDDSLDQNLITIDNNNNNILKSAVLYGANASGKSNVINALAFMRDFVVNCHKFQKGDKINVTPFKLDEETKSSPSTFDVIFIKDDIRYCYGFSLDSRQVYDEHLYYYPKGRQSTIFERSNINKYHFTKDVDEQEALSKRTLENRVYLNTSTEWNYGLSSKAFEWFRDDLIFKTRVDRLEWVPYTSHIIMKNDEMSRLVKRFISMADLGINDFIANVDDIDAADAPKEIPPRMSDLVKKLLKDSRSKRIDIKTIHAQTDINNNISEVLFDLNEESRGTIRLFDLAGRWLDALRSGHILVLDELDASLHPNIVEVLIGQFHDLFTNKTNAQLIFTTHNTHILRLDIFRRDQIWFTEKHPITGSTDLYSLMELKGVRKDENVSRGYLAGKYGAIPFIGGGLEL